MSEWTKVVFYGVILVPVIVALMFVMTIIIVQIIPKQPALPSCVMTAQDTLYRA